MKMYSDMTETEKLEHLFGSAMGTMLAMGSTGSETREGEYRVTIQRAKTPPMRPSAVKVFILTQDSDGWNATSPDLNRTLFPGMAFPSREAVFAAARATFPDAIHRL
jgi:hypothetical protein